MKINEIEVGCIYRGKSGPPRLVLERGELDVLPQQEDKDCLRYTTTPKAPRIRTCTARAFASWARERVE